MKRTLPFCLLALTILPFFLFSQVISHEYNARLLPDQDAHYVLSGTDRGYRTALKFNISRIPQGAIIKTVQLNAHVLYSEVNWNGNVNFYNLNHQSWLETHEADTLETAFRSDSTHQDSLFGMLNLGWHKSVDLTQIFMRDYLQKNEFCTIFMVDPDDQNTQFTPGMPLFDHDTLVCGQESGTSKCVFWSSESPDTLLRPFLGILYCYHTDTNLVLNVCDSIVLNGQTYTSSGMYQQVIPNSLGCDSTINIDLTIRHSTSSKLSLAGCDSIAVNGLTYYRTGLYEQKLVNAVDCDSILHLELIIYHSTITDIDLGDCDSVVVNGQIYTASGTYLQKFTDIHGCDSSVRIHVTIYPTTFGTLMRSACDSLILHGQVYHNSGVYTQVLINAKGCDSILTLILTINPSSQTLVTIELCDSILVNGVVYYRSGNYKQTLINRFGCDSVLLLHLIIHRSYRDTLFYKACNGVTINGKTYSATGIYTEKFSTIHQCDSIVVLDITIHNSTTGNLSLKTCDSTRINGEFYDSTGVFTQLLTNAAGCDSLLIIQLEVQYSTSETLHITACDSAVVNGVRYDSSGTYVQMLKNGADCDSTLILEIDIPIIDTAIVSTGSKLSAVDTTATYQWVDCDNGFAAIPGDTNFVFVATKSGNYALVLSKGGCNDTSACYLVEVVSTDHQEAHFELVLAPNPSNGWLYFKTTKYFNANDVLVIQGINGIISEKIGLQAYKQSGLDLSHLPPGMYFMDFRTSDGRKLLKWLKL